MGESLRRLLREGIRMQLTRLTACAALLALTTGGAPHANRSAVPLRTLVVHGQRLAFGLPPTRGDGDGDGDRSGGSNRERRRAGSRTVIARRRATTGTRSRRRTCRPPWRGWRRWIWRFWRVKRAPPSRSGTSAAPSIRPAPRPSSPSRRTTGRSWWRPARGASSAARPGGAPGSGTPTPSTATSTASWSARSRRPGSPRCPISTIPGSTSAATAAPPGRPPGGCRRSSASSR